MDVTRTTILSILLIIQRWMQEKEALQNTSDTGTSIYRTNRPFVTVSFAQTLDGNIGVLSDSSSSSSNYPISCYESLRLTHALRSIHDGIVIGRETMKLDNPQLTVRHWEEDETLSHPRPILLDTHLRTDFTKCRAQQMIVCCSEEAATRYYNSTNRSCRTNAYWMAYCNDNDDSNGRTTITLLPCATKTYKATRHGEEVTEEVVDLNDVLHKLYDNFHIKRVMVEGGARVLSKFIEEQLVDCLCVTIAPTILAAGKGLAAFSHLLSSSTGDTTVTSSYSLTDVHWKQLGVDGILCGRLS